MDETCSNLVVLIFFGGISVLAILGPYIYFRWREKGYYQCLRTIYKQRPLLSRQYLRKEHNNE